VAESSRRCSGTTTAAKPEAHRAAQSCAAPTACKWVARQVHIEEQGSAPAFACGGARRSSRRSGQPGLICAKKSERAEAARTQGQPVSGNVGKFIVAGQTHDDSESARSSLTSATTRASSRQRHSRRTRPLLQTGLQARRSTTQQWQITARTRRGKGSTGACGAND